MNNTLVSHGPLSVITRLMVAMPSAAKNASVLRQNPSRVWAVSSGKASV
ncbi:MAG: hypothetical protein E6621_06645 [Cutibacterium avidum]|nr:hypothetical protein [Cutibacterium avidum]